MTKRRPASGLSAWTRRRAALIAALALPISLMAAPATATGPTPSPTSTTPPTDAGTPTGAALAQAKKDNKRVEIESLRSETATFYANPDGKTLRAELTTTPVRVKKDDGSWQPVDPTLIEDGGVLRPKATHGNVALSAGGDATAITYTGEQGKMAIAAPAALPKPVVKDNIATYPDAYGPGADLVITVTPSGFRQDVMIRQRPAKDLKLRVPMRLPKSFKLGKGPDKTAGVLDAQGREVDDLAGAPMLDAAALDNPDKGLIGQAKGAVDGDSVVYTAAADFLNDPAVTYPVTVTAASDTWVGTGIAGDTHVSNVLPWGADNDLLNWLLAGRSHSGNRTHRTYIRFNIPDSLKGGTVNNADLRLHNYNSQTCSDTDSPGIDLQQVTTDWSMSTLTWSNQPSTTLTGHVANRGAYSSQIPCPEGEGELYYSIELITQAWMNGTADYGVRLNSVIEPDVTSNWRYYRSHEYGGYDTYPFTPRGPVLFIEYEPAPVETVEVGTFGYGTWDTTEQGLNKMRARETETEDPPFPVLSQEEARQAALNSSLRVSVNANELQPPSHLTGEELEEFGNEEGGGFEDVPEPPPVADTAAPQALTNPADGDSGIPVDVTVRVAFTEPVTGQTFALKDASGKDVAFGTTSIGDDPDTEEVEPSNQGWELKPEQPLMEGERYRIEVKAAADAAGNVMTDYSATFTTVGGATPVAGLVAAYGMNEGSGTSVADSSGQNNTGTGTGTGWADGKYGKALSFNGSTSWVTVQDAASLRLTTGMTLSAWVNPATLSSWRPIVGKELSSDAVSYTLYASNSSAPSGWVQTDPVTHSTVNGTSPLPVNTWSHVALTYDGTALRLFVNGQQVGQTALSGSLYDDGSPLRIGGNAAWGEFFSGLIDEVRVYNRAQTTAEIQTDMNSPVGGSTTPGPTPTPTPTSTPTPDPTPTPVPGLVAAYGMEEGTGTNVGDSSGQNNTGAATDTTWTTGKHGKALSFNGSSSWVTVAHAASLRLTNALTLSAWVQPSAEDGQWRTVMMKETAQGGSYGVYASDGDSPLGWLQIADGARGVADDSALTLNEWSHLALTYDGNITTLYVNGAQVAQTSQITGDLVDDGGALRIGGNSFWGEFYSGLIDEVRVYNRAQTVTEIQTDMNTPIGTAATSSTAQRLSTSTTANPAGGIEKLTVNGSRSVDGVTVASTLTPHLTTWLSAGRDGAAKVEVEIAHKPTKSIKADKVTTDKRLIWSGHATTKPGDSKITLRVPKGRIQDGEKLRWRARIGANGTWSPWQDLVVDSTDTTAGSSSRSSSATTPLALVDDDARVTDCWKNEKEARVGKERGDGTDGYHAGRSNWCAIQPVAGGDAEYGREKFMVNGLTATATIIGYTYANGPQNNSNLRRSHFRISLRDVTPVPLGGVYSLHGMFAFGAKIEDSACKLDGTPYVEGTWQQWRDGKAAEFTVISDAQNGEGPDKVEHCRPKFYTKVWLDEIPSTKPKYYWSDAAPQVRCDSASYFVRDFGSGCVFNLAKAVYETTETQPGSPWSDEGDPDNVNKAYRNVPSHIWTAQHKKELTWPARSDKTIPGHYLANGTPLERQNNGTWRKKNNEKSANLCRILWPDDYKRKDPVLGDKRWQKVYNCDEFPFQSTMQGTWVSVERLNSPDAYAYSIRFVWHKHNTDDGARLGTFYGSQRILAVDGNMRKKTYDLWWVEAHVPGQNPHSNQN
ncbi:LamG-like jellyroll fold domain-containing protein [Nonomuraea sp. 10N515B]|uniref:LamG-like jellyroll fold domain-containing protein n=1 Tax=Nonomuraea sp. 10N515B TaxID=3457422 RepID=UPI003FCCADAE